MTAYAIRRLLLIIPTFLLVTIAVFLSVRLVPGDVIDMMIAQMGSSGSVLNLDRGYIEKSMGLDVPAHIQYVRWLGVAPQANGEFRGILEGNFGQSLWKREDVSKLIVERLPVSLELGVFAILTALLISIPIGIYSAIRQDTWGDYIARSISIIFISVPAFWIGTIVWVYPSIWWGWSPPVELIPFMKDPWGNFLQFLLPGFIMGMVMGGTLMRITRTMMLEVLRQDYIRTAWSKGLKENTVIMRHALKNTLIPVVTIVGVMVPMVIAGTVIIEQIFVLPGIGLLTLDALNNRDYPMISGINVFLATIVLLVNILVDLTYAWLDPRVQYR